LKYKAPSLYLNLKSRGKLEDYCPNLADEISSEAISQMISQRGREKWDDLGPMESAGRMKMQLHLNIEALLEQALEFPPEEISSPSQD
jgi:hypothetical protein